MKSHKTPIKIKLLKPMNSCPVGHVQVYEFDVGDQIIEQGFGEVTNEKETPRQLDSWQGQRKGDEEVARREAVDAENERLKEEIAALRAEKEPKAANAGK